MLSLSGGLISLTSVSSGGDIEKVGGLRSVGSIMTEGLGLSGRFQSSLSLMTGTFPPIALVKASTCSASLSV